jgi:hypothetical protein
MLLSKVSESAFEIAGSVVGFSASVFIGLQIHAELISDKPSSLSPLFILGFFLNYVFWVLYGFRFRRIAVWLVNVVAAAFQAILLAIVLMK